MRHEINNNEMSWIIVLTGIKDIIAETGEIPSIKSNSFLTRLDAQWINTQKYHYRNGDKVGNCIFLEYSDRIKDGERYNIAANFSCGKWNFV